MKKKILIVEDNPRNMRLFQIILRGGDYTLLKATDGEEALRVAVSEQPDLILMDIKLPKMNGLEVTMKLRQNPAFRHTPIIAVTAYAMKRDRERVIESGCDAYLSKPVRPGALKEIVGKALLRRQKDNLSLDEVGCD